MMLEKKHTHATNGLLMNFPPILAQLSLRVDWMIVMYCCVMLS